MCCPSRADRPVARHSHEVETEFGKLLRWWKFQKIMFNLFWKYLKFACGGPSGRKGSCPLTTRSPASRLINAFFEQKKSALISKNYFKFNFENISISKIICCRSRADRPVARHLHEVETEFGKLMRWWKFEKIIFNLFWNI